MKTIKPSEILKQYHQDIYTIITAHRATNPRIFGSVAQGLDNVLQQAIPL